MANMEMDKDNDRSDDRIVDGRGLEPPEPFVLTMEALDTIEPGQTVLLKLGREPFDGK